MLVLKAERSLLSPKTTFITRCISSACNLGFVPRCAQVSQATVEGAQGQQR